MIISYPKWKRSNSRSCEIHFRAVINMTQGNLAGMQQIQALIWSDLTLPTVFRMQPGALGLGP